MGAILMLLGGANLAIFIFTLPEKDWVALGIGLFCFTLGILSDD